MRIRYSRNRMIGGMLAGQLVFVIFAIYDFFRDTISYSPIILIMAFFIWTMLALAVHLGFPEWVMRAVGVDFDMNK